VFGLYHQAEIQGRKARYPTQCNAHLSYTSDIPLNSVQRCDQAYIALQYNHFHPQVATKQKTTIESSELFAILVSTILFSPSPFDS
jgi:hypothetical protein